MPASTVVSPRQSAKQPQRAATPRREAPPLVLSPREGPTPSQRPSFRKGYRAANGTVIRYTPDWTKQHKVEGDGLLTNLYEFLAKSDKAGEHRLRAAWLPDTVIFDHNFPSAWYTFDAKAKEIVKQPGKMLDANSIYDVFSEPSEGCDIVAQFYRKNATPDAASGPSALQSTKRSGSPGRNRPPRTEDLSTEEETGFPPTGVEFFTAETLYAFLHSTQPKPDGVLQKFVVPRGKSNSRSNFQLQAVWTPLVALVYKRTNNRMLGDKTVPVHERGTTFDGPPHYSCEARVAAGTQVLIHQVCCAVVDHFFATEQKKIVRMILYFKEDTNKRLWLLWGSSVRVEGTDLHPVKVRVPVQLGMKVHGAAQAAPSADGKIAHASDETIERELLRRDLEMYSMTGDMQFARLCGGRVPGPPQRKAPATARPTAKSGAAKKDPFAKHARASISSAQSSPARQQPTQHQEPSTVPKRRAAANDDDRNSTSGVYSDDGFDSDSGTDDSPRRAHAAFQPAVVASDADAESRQEEQSLQAATADGGAVAEEKDAAPHRIAFSPRAPFFPLRNGQTPLSPESERHPLHDRYEALQDDLERERDARNARAGTSRRGQSALLKPKPPAERQVPKPYTAEERAKRDLVATALDCVYVTYSDTLQECRSDLALSVRSSGGNDGDAPALIVDVPPIFEEVLAPDDFDEMLAKMGLSRAHHGQAHSFELPASAISRGRRRDRPAAHVERDIKALFERAFEVDSEGIIARIETYRTSGTHRYTMD